MIGGRDETAANSDGPEGDEEAEGGGEVVGGGAFEGGIGPEVGEEEACDDGAGGTGEGSHAL